MCCNFKEELIIKRIWKSFSLIDWEGIFRFKVENNCEGD